MIGGIPIQRHLICTLIALGLLSPLPAADTDLSKIERTIGKEPDYSEADVFGAPCESRLTRSKARPRLHCRFRRGSSGTWLQQRSRTDPGRGAGRTAGAAIDKLILFNERRHGKSDTQILSLQ